MMLPTIIARWYADEFCVLRILYLRKSSISEKAILEIRQHTIDHVTDLRLGIKYAAVFCDSVNATVSSGVTSTY
jgi:hypothetical protein